MTEKTDSNSFGAAMLDRDNALRERAPNYPVIAAWSAFLALIGAGAFVLGMAIHNESFAQPKPPRPERIYYCATAAELPAFEPRGPAGKTHQ